MTSTAPRPSSAASTGSGASHVDGTVPYRWPWDGDLDPSRLALIIAGADPAWFARSVDAEAVAAGIDRTATIVRRVGGRVVHVAHQPISPGHPLPDAALEHHPTLPGSLVDRSVDLTVVAGGIDGFFGSPLDQLLRRDGLDHLLLAGFGLEGPVHSTMRSANDAGYECLLLTDLGATLDPACHDAAIATVTMSGGIFGAIGTSPSLCAALGD